MHRLTAIAWRALLFTTGSVGLASPTRRPVNLTLRHCWGRRRNGSDAKVVDKWNAPTRHPGQGRRRVHRRAREITASAGGNPPDMVIMCATTALWPASPMTASSRRSTIC